MAGLSIMAVEQAAGREMGVRCRFINGWCKIDSCVPDQEGLLCEIEKNRPDVVLIDLNLYAKMDGIETSRAIRSRFCVPVYYV